MSKENKKVSAPLEVIENQLLVALDDKSKVAILATREDLDLFISVLQHALIGRRELRLKLLTGLRQLRDAAFKDRACRVCGCTDNKACPGGCHWVEDDLCSQCKS